jgi:hypothetical protein
MEKHFSQGVLAHAYNPFGKLRQENPELRLAWAT